ncbi:MAG: hypothetical protein KDA90_00040, partial [Planctomycetaceae bacterium]|nr:hypothetical protein [Planctomycetaceae bacterium]
ASPLHIECGRRRPSAAGHPEGTQRMAMRIWQADKQARCRQTEGIAMMQSTRAGEGFRSLQLMQLLCRRSELNVGILMPRR